MHFLRFELAFTGFFRQFGQLLADFFQTFLIHVFDDRNNQAVRCIGCETDVKVVFQNQIVAIQRSVEFREGFQRRNGGFDDERQWRQFHALAFPFFVQLFAEFFQFGHVRFFVNGNVRDNYPVAGQVLTGNFLNAGQFFNFDIAEFGEVHFRPRQQVQTAAQRCAGSSRFRRTALHHGFHKGFNVVAHDTAFQAGTFDLTQIYTQFARQFACGRTRVCFGESGFVNFGSGRCRSGNRSWSCGRRGSRSRRSCRCGGLSRRGSGGRTGGFHFDNGSTFGYFVADFQEYSFNDTGGSTRYVHGRFVGFQSNQRVVFSNSVANFDFNGDYIYISMTANVGNGYLNGCTTCGSGSGCSGRRRLCFSRRSRSGFSSGSTGFNGQDHAAFGDFVADFDFHFFHNACCIGRYVHSRFVGFQCNQGVVNGDGVARFDFYGDNINVFMTADIRHFNFYDTHLSSF